jgi:hypothetical protein
MTDGDTPATGETLYFHQAVYTKADLDKAPEDEAVFFLMCCQMHNEVATLYRLLIQNPIQPDAPEPVKAAAATTSLLALRMLAGRLYESWEYIRGRYRARYDAYGDAISQEAKSDFAALGKYFGKHSLIYRLRNKVSFHSDEENMRLGYRALPQDEVLVDHHHAFRGNTVFYGSEMMMTSAMNTLVEGAVSAELAFETIQAEIREVASRFFMVTGTFTLAFAKRYLPAALEGMRKNIIEVPDQPTPDQSATRPFLALPKKPRATIRRNYKGTASPAALSTAYRGS